jgi:hypothetical protein
VSRSELFAVLSMASAVFASSARAQDAPGIQTDNPYDESIADVPPEPVEEAVFEPETPPEPALDEQDPEEPVEEESTRLFETRIYGFISAYWEKEADQPDGIDPVTGETLLAESPHEFDVLNAHLIVDGTFLERYKYHLNLASAGAGSVVSDEPVAIRNAWVDLPIAEDYLRIRAGKLYRPFGLYNELLDAVPTYFAFIGIEPPEIFDDDHLMLTRATNFMLYGEATWGEEGAIRYSVTTGNDERDSDVFPLGADLRVDFAREVRVGSSFYWTAGDAVPSRAMGEGSPRGGVVNWMERDRFWVVGGYLQLHIEGFLLQLEYWHASHDARRNPSSVGTSAADPNSLASIYDTLSPGQRSRFWVNGADPASGVNVDADYHINTAYVRALYEIELGSAGTLSPYFQYDFYSNPEIIALEDFGGDDEAGDSDEGVFHKLTLGFAWRVASPIVLKIDGSVHIQEFNGETFVYPEGRAQLSYQWELEI